MAPIIIDIEASGFGRGSYPIEVGLVLPDGTPHCFLIAPDRKLDRLGRGGGEGARHQPRDTHLLWPSADRGGLAPERTAVRQDRLQRCLVVRYELDGQAVRGRA